MKKIVLALLLFAFGINLIRKAVVGFNDIDGFSAYNSGRVIGGSIVIIIGIVFIYQAYQESKVISNK